MPMARLLGIVLVVGCAACSGGPDAEGAGAADSAAAVADGGGDLSDYPPLYRSLNLPALPGATVTSTGRQTTSLRDGLAIRLTTSDTVAEVRDFYRDRLVARGWAEQVGAGRAAEAMMPNLPLSRLVFTQEGVSFTATITATDGLSDVQLSVVER